MIYDVTNIKSTWFKREPNEPKIHSESLIFYKIKCILKAAGFDVIKKRPDKDGNLTDAPYYIRDRKHKFCLHDGGYMIRSLCDVFNDFEEIRLSYHDF